MLSNRLRVAGAVLAVAAGSGLVGCGASGPGRLVHLRQRFLLEVAPRNASSARLEIVTASGRVIRRIANSHVGIGTQAGVSPDGKLLAWAAGPNVALGGGNYGSSDVVLERVDSSARRVVAGVGFVWSPDSKAILTNDPRGDLDIVSVATGARRQIVKAPPRLQTTPLAWLPSHRILYMESRRPGNRADPILLVLAKQNGASPHRIYDNSEQTQEVPSVSVSPNGEWINVISFPGLEGGPPSPSQFQSINTLTGKTTRARNFNSYNTGTVWSPDSNRVVAGSPNGPTEILSPAGKVLATIRQNSLFPVGWTRGAIYLLPGPGRAHGESPDRLFAIPAGQTTAQVIFKLPKQVIYQVQPF